VSDRLTMLVMVGIRTGAHTLGSRVGIGSGTFRGSTANIALASRGQKLRIVIVGVYSLLLFIR